MAAECSDARLVPLPMTIEQRWVVHAVLLDYVELAADAGAAPEELTCELDVLEALEAGDSAFTVHELDRVRHEVAAYARASDTPERDRDTAGELVDRLDHLLATQPA